eukprot:5957182-Amphidinium_carterae.1
MTPGSEKLGNACWNHCCVELRWRILKSIPRGGQQCAAHSSELHFGPKSSSPFVLLQPLQLYSHPALVLAG